MGVGRQVSGKLPYFPPPMISLWGPGHIHPWFPKLHFYIAFNYLSTLLSSTPLSRMHSFMDSFHSFNFFLENVQSTRKINTNMNINMDEEKILRADLQSF